MNLIKSAICYSLSFSVFVGSVVFNPPIIAYAKEDPTRVQVVGTQRYDDEDWWAEAIGAYDAWRFDTDSLPVTVGIIDTGVDLTHPEFEGRANVLPNYPRNVPADHGTHVAGLIGAGNNSFGIRGIADRSMLLCVDVSDDNDGIVLTDVLNQIDVLLDSGAKVINCSWGNEVLSLDGLVREDFPDIKPLWWDEILGGPFAIMATEYRNLLGRIVYHFVGVDDAYMEYRQAYAKRIGLQCAFPIIMRLMDDDPNNDDFVIVQSAGNGLSSNGGNTGEGTNSTLNGFFASFTEDAYNSLSSNARRKLEERGITYERVREHIIIVGAVENATDGNGRYKLTGYSNYGDNVDIVAPGGTNGVINKDKKALLSTVPNGYKALNGTSMAAPLVTGSIAYLLSLENTLTAVEARQILLDSAETAVDNKHGSFKSYPMLNIGNATERLIERTGYTTAKDWVAKMDYNGHTYALFDNGKDWHEARAFCQSLGGYLASITSKKENSVLYNFVSELGYSDVCFGLSDEVIDYFWKWESGEAYKYNRWHYGEPNHEGGYEHYGMYYHKFPDGTWNDGDGGICPFLCEWNRIVN